MPKFILISKDDILPLAAEMYSLLHVFCDNEIYSASSPKVWTARDEARKLLARFEGEGRKA